MSEGSIRLTEYATLPSFDVPHGVALGIAVVNAVPPSAPTEAKTAAGAVRESTLALQASWGASRNEPKPVDTRIVDTRVDNAWSNLARALDSVRSLKNSDRAGAAAELHEELFASGLSFLQLKYPAQWAECNLRLETIDEKELEPKLNGVLGGPEYVSEIRAAQVEYGEALGIDQPKPQTSSVNLAESLSALREACVAGAGLIATSRQEACRANSNTEPFAPSSGNIAMIPLSAPHRAL